MFKSFLANEIINLLFLWKHSEKFTVIISFEEIKFRSKVYLQGVPNIIS